MQSLDDLVKEGKPELDYESRMGRSFLDDDGRVGDVRLYQYGTYRIASVYVSLGLFHVRQAEVSADLRRVDKIVRESGASERRKLEECKAFLESWSNFFITLESSAVLRAELDCVETVLKFRYDVVVGTAPGTIEVEALLSFHVRNARSTKIS